MNTLLRHLPTEYTQKTGHCQFVGFDIGMATEPNYTLDGSLTAENTHVNRFHFYRAADDFATELHPIPTMVKGGYYGLRESARQAVEPEDPIELVQCVVKSSVLLPITDRVLGKNTVVYEAMTVKNTARLAAFLKSISLHKWYVPETLVSPAKNPVDKWTARLKDFSSLELGWDS